MAFAYKEIPQVKMKGPLLSLVEITEPKEFIGTMYPFKLNDVPFKRLLAGPWTHPVTYSPISLKSPSTVESLCLIAGGGNGFKYFGHGGIRLGEGVLMQEGFFVNPPMDLSNKRECEIKKILLDQLKYCEEANGIYLGENDFGFAPRESFKTGTIESREFIKGGLARVIEHTAKDAQILFEILSKRVRPVCLDDFDLCPTQKDRVFKRNLRIVSSSILGKSEIQFGHGGIMYAYGVYDPSKDQKIEFESEPGDEILAAISYGKS